MPRHAIKDQGNVFLFIPNLIGYSRIVFAITALYYMPYHPRTCSLLYSISCLLDALDGAAAGYFNQSTRFGAVLDMITDRCTTTCLLVFLASAFPRWSIIFQGLISLDYSSHYIHMYATLATGSKQTLRIYYSNPNTLFTICALNELFFIALYLLSFSSDSSPSVEGWPSAWSAGAMETARANKICSSWPRLLFYASLPFMLFKQYVNVLQLIQASKRLVQADINARRQSRAWRRRK
ncbi:CDP-alcohol phosphatidyltransferase-domain-containing protein [Aspergillus californicus]